MIDFGEVLTRAWNIAWRYKILWLFGFFAALGAGGSNSGGSLNFNFSLPNGRGNFPNAGNIPYALQRFFNNIPAWAPVLLGLLVLLLVIVLIILNAFGRIGLARGSWVADAGADRLTFGQLWDAGQRYFWRVILLILLLWALAIAISLIVILPAVGISILTFGIGLICLLPLLCVLVIALWALTVITDLAVIALVNENLGVIEALQRAWNVFKSRPADIIVMAFILWLISVIVGFIIGLPMLLVAAPVIGSVILRNGNVMNSSIIVSVILFLLYLPILLFLQSIVQTYLYTAWTLVYRRLTGRGHGAADQTVIDVTPRSTVTPPAVE